MPATKTMTSFAAANSRSFLSRPDTCPQIVSFAWKSMADLLERPDLELRDPFRAGRRAIVVERRLVHRRLGEQHRLPRRVDLRGLLDRS